MNIPNMQKVPSDKPKLSWQSNSNEYAKTCLIGLPFVNAVYYKINLDSVSWFIDHDGCDDIIAHILYNSKVMMVSFKGDHRVEIYNSWRDEVDINWTKLNS